MTDLGSWDALAPDGAGRDPARRPKDEADFDAALPVLSEAGRVWLAEAIALCSPGHPWLGRLS